MIQHLCKPMLVAMLLAPAVYSYAAVSEDEAAKLSTTLTPMGAEKAGNADGTIPEWTGGYQGKPEGYSFGDISVRPFPNEKPELTINSQNADQYADKLSAGVKKLLSLYPDYQLEVYPTHRTASAPQWLYDYTKENAVSATLSDDVKTVSNAYGGVPFPLPQSGGEVVWNHILSWKGSAVQRDASLWLVDSRGELSLTAEVKMEDVFRYSLPGEKEGFDGFWQWHRALTVAPGRSAGENLVGVWPMDFKANSPGSWQYMPGQRRVRKLPNIMFDTPNFYVSGLMQFDEAYGWFGSPEQYNWNMIGKKEVYVPYNTNMLMAHKPEDIFNKGFIDPSAVRWELHRVWVVEGTLRDGARNTVPRRRLYIDEDSWNVVLSDLWDSQDQLYRGAIAYTSVNYDLPGVVSQPFQVFDFQQQAYTVGEFINRYIPVKQKPRSYFTGESLVQGALR